jgi:lipoate-protein ligase A
MDIEKAIEIEKEYLAIIDNKEQAKFNLKERLEYLGFTLESFFISKQDYLFKQKKFKIVETTPATIVNETMQSIKNGEETCFIISQDTDWVFYGIDEANKQYVEDNKLNFLDLGYQGGTIVSTPSDLELVIVMKQHDMNYYIRNNVSKLLNEMGVEHLSNNNDLLIHSDILLNDFKVCGFAEKNLGNEYSLYYVQVSFKLNRELIEKVCITDSKKVPMGINDFYPDLNRKQLVGLIKEWLS